MKVALGFLDIRKTAAFGLVVTALAGSAAYAGGSGGGGIVNISCAYGYLIYSPPSPSSGNSGGISWLYGSGDPGWSGYSSSSGSTSKSAPFRIQCEGSSLPDEVTVFGDFVVSVIATGQYGSASATNVFSDSGGQRGSIAASAAQPTSGSDSENIPIDWDFVLDSSQGGDFSCTLSLTVN